MLTPSVHDRRQHQEENPRHHSRFRGHWHLPGHRGAVAWPWYTRASAKPAHIPILRAFDRADGGLDLESHDVHNLRGSTSLTENDDERDTRSSDSSADCAWGPG